MLQIFEQVHKLSIKTFPASTFPEVLYICAQSFWQNHKILEKEKYTSHTIARLMMFTRPHSYTRVESLLNGPVEFS